MKLLLFVFVSSAVNSAFVPDEASAPMNSKLLCPEKCRCLEEEKTTSCLLQHSEFSLESLAPWRVKSLELYRDKNKPENVVFPSLKSVIYEDSALAVTNTENAIIGLPHLVHLDVSNIAITQLNDFVFSNMPRLKILKLTNDNISAIQASAFAGLSKLRVLNLENNDISDLPVNVFHDLTSLTVLDLSGNNIKVIPEHLFVSLSTLEKLDLSGNALTYIGGFTDNFRPLEFLDISHNSIRYLTNDTVNSLLNTDTVVITGNKFECSCAIEALIHAAQQNLSFKHSEDVTCAGPSNMIGQSFKDIVIEKLPCEGARVDSVTDPFDSLQLVHVMLNCTSTGTSPVGIYWITPWGDKFTHPDMHDLLPEHIVDVKYDKHYKGVNLPIVSEVYVSENGSLHIDQFRGYFSGNFSCVAVNLISTDEVTTEIGIYNNFEFYYHTSLFVSAVCVVAVFTIAVIVGAIRWCVSKCFHEDDCNCCCCSSDDEFVSTRDIYKVESEEIEVINGELHYKSKDSSADDDEDFYKDSPPKTPFNSPMYQTPSLTPKKCHTPDEEAIEPEGWISARILDQLDEVRSRLRYGAERRMMKVKSLGRSIHESGSNKIKNIKESGSLKIQSIKETGSQTATAVIKSLESGMEQVKYGYQSIKEFCGTSDMGPGTISMVSVSTDVDTKEQVRVVKSHTFV